MQYMIVSTPEANAQQLIQIIESAGLDAKIVMGQPVDTTPGPWNRPTDSQLERGRIEWNQTGNATAWETLNEQGRYEYVHEFIVPEDGTLLTNMLIVARVIDDDDYDDYDDDDHDNDDDDDDEDDEDDED